MGLGTRTYVWNASTLDWEAMTNTSVTVGELTVSGVAVSNMSKTEQYKFADMDVSSDPFYFGYVDQDGNWYIMELNDASGTARYVKGSSGYTTAWTNRATQTYGYYNAVF